jgi:Pyridoxamine 5'-phosphate oxidase
MTCSLPNRVAGHLSYAEGARTMDQHAIDEVLNRPLSQELLARDLARLAFIALDGTPRSIPIGITWNGAEIVMCTAKNARKLPALRRSPAVALTIDTESHPPKVLLIRGRAELDAVDGIPVELTKYHTPSSRDGDPRAPANTLGASAAPPASSSHWPSRPHDLLDG